MRSTTKLSSKGQVVLPKEIRDRHGWKAGMEMEVVDLGHSITLRPVDQVPETTFDDLFGCLDYDGPPLSVEEMDEAAAKGFRERWGHEYDDRD